MILFSWWPLRSLSFNMKTKLKCGFWPSRFRVASHFQNKNRAHVLEGVANLYLKKKQQEMTGHTRKCLVEKLERN